MIGRAIELRQSIPWANASAVWMVDDPNRPGEMKVRPGARNGLVLLLLFAVAVAGGYYFWVTHPGLLGGEDKPRGSLLAVGKVTPKQSEPIVVPLPPEPK